MIAINLNPDHILILYSDVYFLFLCIPIDGSVRNISELPGDETIPGSLPSNLNMTTSQPSFTDYQTFERGESKISTRISVADSHSHADHSHQENKSTTVRNGRKIALRDFFTVLALSFHAVFEGLAIGLEPESTDIWILFAGNIIFSI